ncbi:MAG: hypothetical protein HYR96_02230 [Deltaproteobacteria bacterium]|nr:hypothetical protein [Deltaproteobacteria bacterium]MBI3293125.1 hypothetical protein [Deltaproteobacteria bacterium]
MKNQARPWLFLLLTAPVPLILFGVLAYRWYVRQTDSTRVTRHLIQRQNTVIATDANEVARQVTSLLVRSTETIRSLPLVRAEIAVWSAFRIIHQSPIAEWNGTSHTIERRTIPLFSQVSRWTEGGDEDIRIDESTKPPLRKFTNCDVRLACDRALLHTLTSAPDKTVRFGRLLRPYTPLAGPDDARQAAIWIGYRDGGHIYTGAMDYRHLKSLILSPIFPYDPLGDPLEAYRNGNYTFVVDIESTVLVHPKHWHVAGLQRETGAPIPPMEYDSDEGTHPLNIARYQGTTLKSFFDHLLQHSLRIKTVDIFPASNLKGTHRVIATAPVLFEDAQFRAGGVFGYVIAGCNNEYYEEPKEKSVPYY